MVKLTSICSLFKHSLSFEPCGEYKVSPAAKDDKLDEREDAHQEHKIPHNF